MVFETLLNPVLNMNPLVALLIISFVLALLITLIYKKLTNQELMKRLRDEMKEHQKEMKDYRSNPQKMMAVQKKAMEKNMQYMMHSFKPMLITLLPLLIIFGWLNANMAYEPIKPFQEFTTTAVFAKDIYGAVILIVPEGLEVIGEASQDIKDGKAEWTLKGGEGEYLLEYQFEDKGLTREVLISKENVYKNPIYNTKEKDLKSLNINNQPKKYINLFGWQIGWLGTYIIFSLVFSMGLRKILKIY